MAAAEEQQRRAKRSTLRFQCRALLQEAAERREASAGSDHDQWYRGIGGQAEAGLGLAHDRMHGIAGAAAAEIVGADAAIDAAAGMRRALHHGGGDAAA